MESLFYLLNAIYPLSEELKQHLFQVLRTSELKKKGMLLKAGHICRNIYFIEKGLLKCYYEEGGGVVNSWFMKEGDVIASVQSFFDQKESYESIEAIEDCILHYISFQQLQHIYKTYIEFNYVGRELVQKYYKLAEERLYYLRMKKKPERYEHLRNHHPELIQRVSQQDIALYLRINPRYVSMSKSKGFRKRLSR